MDRSVSSPWTQSVVGVHGPGGQCFRVILGQMYVQLKTHSLKDQEESLGFLLFVICLPLHSKIIIII